MLESVVFATVFVAGLVIGSFLNLVIHRGPVMWGLIDGPVRGNLIAPRSYCPSCKSQLTALNLVPIASYIAQRGQCTKCGARISARYPLVEALGAITALLAVASFGMTTAALFAAIFAFALIALALIDLETSYLPDALTLPLIGLGLAANAFGLFASFADSAIGAFAGYAVFWLIGIGYQHLRGREGLGRGDAKLLAAIGAWTGWQGLPVVIFVAALGTLVAISALRVAGHRSSRDQPVPFGPGLCAAGVVTLFIGDRLLSAL